jgi:allantoin racemase
MHLRIVTPTTATALDGAALEGLRAVLRPTTELDVVMLDQGPESIETEPEEALSVPGTLQRVAEAVRARCDGVIINCVGDPGLAAARELVAIPVVGPGQAGMHLASMLGGRFSILVARGRGIAAMRSLVARYGLQAKLASVRALEIPIGELRGGEERLLGALVREAQLATKRDGAEVVMLGSTGMVQVARRLAASLAEMGVRVPVVDPLLSAVILAEGLVSAGVSHYRSDPTSPSMPAVGASHPSAHAL